MRFAHLLLLVVALAGFSAAQETNFPVGPQYLSLTGTNFLRPIATPIISLEAPLPPVPSLPEIGPPVSGQPYISNPELEHQADLFPIYYGYPPIPVLILAGSESSEAPPSLAGDGVTHMVNVESLRKMGYGVSVGEDAAFWKAHKPGVSHVYTNADIQHLHQD